MHCRLMVALCLCLFMLFVIPVTAISQPQPLPEHRHLSGIVTKLKAGHVFIKTREGTRALNAKTDLPDAQIGDEVTLWVNHSNVVIAAFKTDKPVPVHRTIRVNLAWASPARQAITFWTPEKGTKAHPLRPSARNLHTV